MCHSPGPPLPRTIDLEPHALLAQAPSFFLPTRPSRVSFPFLLCFGARELPVPCRPLSLALPLVCKRSSTPKAPNASSSSAALIFPTIAAGVPLKPPVWAKISPPSPLHSKCHPLHDPSPMDRCLTLFSFSLHCRCPPRPLAVTRRLRRGTSPHVHNSATLSAPGLTGEPPPQLPCPAGCL
jgi:hypothetical protein